MTQSKLLLQFKELKHFFFDKKDSIESKEYRDLIDKSFSVGQVHRNKVLVLTEKSRCFKNADGMVTNKPFFLKIRTADCLPIFFYEHKKKIIGAIHAGWRGLLAGIINEALLQIEKLGGERKNIISAVGPHIRVCCYNVPFEKVLRFHKKIGDKAPQAYVCGIPNFFGGAKSAEAPLSGAKADKTQIAEYRNSQWYLDLDRIASLQMENWGILKKNIEILPICTSCDRRFFSYRRDGRSCGRMYSIVGLKKGD